MKSLTEIGNKFQTDKGSRHFYLGLYELLFKEIVKLPEQRILEIGFQFGYSLKTWQDYFDKPVIIGIDSVNNGVEIDRVTTIIGDAYDVRMLTVISDYAEFHLIIDDGSHNPHHQAFVVGHYSDLLAPNGILIIEDVADKKTIQFLKSALPKGFRYVAVDMTEGVTDSRLFVCWRG